MWCAINVISHFEFLFFFTKKFLTDFVHRFFIYFYQKNNAGYRLQCNFIKQHKSRAQRGRIFEFFEHWKHFASSGNTSGRTALKKKTLMEIAVDADVATVAQRERCTRSSNCAKRAANRESKPPTRRRSAKYSILRIRKNARSAEDFFFWLLHFFRRILPLFFCVLEVWDNVGFNWCGLQLMWGHIWIFFYTFFGDITLIKAHIN